MKTAGPTSDFCAAFGCPLFGVYGVSGKWYCCCHFNVQPSLNDALTLVLNSHKALCDKAVLLRRTFAGYKAVKDVEDRLKDLCANVTGQVPLPVDEPAHVPMPTHEPAYHPYGDEVDQ